MIKAGIGQKYGHVIQGYASFVCGITIGLIYGWLLALILVAAFPVMAALIML
jgi:tetrahydromethanopterin S-methyltransferase subunit B